MARLDIGRTTRSIRQKQFIANRASPIFEELRRIVEMYEALARAEERLGRRVSVTVYTAAEFHRRRKARHPFLTKVLGGKHVVLVGSEDAIAAR